MGALFFITTIVFAALFIAAKADNRNLRGENERLKNELFKKHSETLQEQPLNDTDEVEKHTEQKHRQNSVDSTYDVSYMHGISAEKSVAFTVENTTLPNNKTASSPNDESDETSSVNHSENFKSEKRRVSSINVLLVIGSLFIILAGFIFATTTWASLGNIVKAVTILSFSAVLFAVSSLSERKFDLPKTGKVFYTLGCAFLPITVLAVAYFKIFGEWFSLGGNGSGAVVAVAAALTGAVCFKGSFDYRSREFAWGALASVSAVTASLAFQIFGDHPDLMILSYAVYSMAVILISRIIQQKSVKSNTFAYIIEVLPDFELVNTAMLSLASLIVSAAWLDHSFVVTISCGIFAASYIFSGFSKKNGFAGAVPFLLFLSIASFYGLSPENFSEGTYVAAAVATVVTVLSFLKVLPEKFAYAIKILSNICIGAAAVLLAIAAVSSEITLASVIVLALLTLEILLLGIFRRDAGKMLFVLFSFALSSTILSAVSLMTSSDRMFAAVSCGALLAVSAGYVIADVILNQKGREFALRLVFTDVMLSAFTAVVLVAAGEISLTAVVCTAVTMFLFSFFPKKNWEKFAFSFFAMLSLGMTASVDTLTERFSDTLLFTAISAVLAVISIVLMIAKKNKLTENGAISGFSAVTAVYMFISSFKLFSQPDPVWQLWLILAVVFAVKGCLSKHKAPISASIILFCLTFGGFAYEVMDFGADAELIAAGGFASILFAALLFAPYSELIGYCRKFTFFCLDFISFVLLCMLASTGKTSAAINVGTLIIFAMTVTSGLITFGSAPLTLPFSAAYFAVANQLKNTFNDAEAAIGIAIAAMIVLSAAASFCLYKNSVVEKKCKGVDFDGFAFARIAGIAAYYFHINGEISQWLGLWLICAVIVSFWRKGSKPLTNRIIASAAMLVPVAAWWSQPFIKLPESFAIEINTVPILIYLAALRFLKWDKKHIDTLTFFTYIIVYVILFFHAVSGTLGNALVVMISAFVILAVSFMIKMKRWFVLSAAVITTSAIFMSIKQWGSPAWWVYLLAAGLILIAVGAFNEQRKKSADGGVTGKITRFMSEWTW